MSSYECSSTDKVAGPVPFYANIVEQKVLDLQFLLLESNSHHATHIPRPRGSSQSGDFYIELQRSGSGLLTQDGRTAFLRQGDFCLCDMSRPLSWSFENDYSLYKILIPREKFANKIGSTLNLTARAIRGNSVSGALVYSFLMKYVPFLDTISPQQANQLADILLNLIISALSELSIATPAQPCGHSVIFYKAQEYLEQNLSRPELTVQECAARCGISTRYLQKLFQEKGLSVNKWIQQRRMQNYKLALVNPLFAEMNITQLAYGCGFSDISNLSRKFKTEMLMTPSEYRKLHTSRM